MGDFTLSPPILAAILCNAPSLVFQPPPPPPLLIIIAQFLSLAESRTWTVFTEGRLLDHCAMKPRRTLSGKIIIFKVLFP